MSTILLFEDGHGNVVSKNGGPEAIDYIVDENEFMVETIATHTEYLKDAPTMYECISSSEAVGNSHLNCSKMCRECILIEEHEMTVINFVDTNPSATVVEVTEYLLNRFNDFKFSHSIIYNFMGGTVNQRLRSDMIGFAKRENADMNFLMNCVFLDELAFGINMKRSMVWSKKGTRIIATRSTTRANTTPILGDISDAGLIAISVRKPWPTKKKKVNEYISSGTVVGHYISFLKMTLDKMDKHPYMKGHYIVMDNAPIHMHENINILNTKDTKAYIALPILLNLAQ
ncbi:hypothetical protein G6F37_008781 [Rhizopus arrhizus]|nr:hypothetical protein G6F38_007867 [Rhizopus arrhizus]KAG1155173.1 hypothetical protein G6F37_008781 [Rhizopus arrhizus]